MFAMSELQAYLIRTGQTQTDLARRLGVSKQRVSAILQGARPSLALALRIQEITGIPPHRLVISEATCD